MSHRKPQRVSIDMIERAINKQIKDKAREEGHHLGKPIYRYQYELPDGRVGLVEATNRSDARAFIKREYGFKKRLPVGTTITKVATATPTHQLNKAKISAR